MHCRSLFTRALQNDSFGKTHAQAIIFGFGYNRTQEVRGEGWRGGKIALSLPYYNYYTMFFVKSQILKSEVS